MAAAEVIIVDDSLEIRYLVSLLLRCDLDVPCLALETLSEVRQHAREVLGSRAIILDINLGPDQPDGVAVYHWLVSHDYRGHVFFMTGHAKESPTVRAASRTGVRILEKPMLPDDLVAMLRDVLRDSPPQPAEETRERA